MTVSVPGRLQANLITFNSVISACAKGADSWSLYALHFGENINSIYIYKSEHNNSSFVWNLLFTRD